MSKKIVRDDLDLTLTLANHERLVIIGDDNNVSTKLGHSYLEGSVQGDDNNIYQNKNDDRISPLNNNDHWKNTIIVGDDNNIVVEATPHSTIAVSLIGDDNDFKIN